MSDLIRGNSGVDGDSITRAAETLLTFSHQFPFLVSMAQLINKLADASSRIKISNVNDQTDQVRSLIEAIGTDFDDLKSEVVDALDSLARTSAVEMPAISSLPDSPLRDTEPTASASTDVSVDHLYSHKQLDEDYSSARFLSDAAAAERIRIAAESGDHLAEAYWSSLFVDKDNLEKDTVQALTYAERAMPWLREHSDGNSFAQYALALCLLNGQGVDKNETEAMRLLTLSGEEGCANAQWQLGVCIEGSGPQATVDHKEAFRYYELAAQQNHPRAQCSLGNSYIHGIGVEENAEEGVRYLQRSADQGYAEAYHKLSLCYLQGTGVVVDNEQFLVHLREAVGRGSVPAQITARIFDIREGVSREVKTKHFTSVAKILSKTMYDLGLQHLMGTNGPVDLEEAADCFKSAAEQGHEQAQYELGVCYLNGRGLLEDHNQAIRYFSLAAKQGNANAHCRLGLCIMEGIGENTNVKDAVRYYVLAAHQNQPHAQYLLGECYENGVCVREDMVEAMKYYRLAAEQGHPEAKEKMC